MLQGSCECCVAGLAVSVGCLQQAHLLANQRAARMAWQARCTAHTDTATTIVVLQGHVM